YVSEMTCATRSCSDAPVGDVCDIYQRLSLWWYTQYVWRCRRWHAFCDRWLGAQCQGGGGWRGCRLREERGENERTVSRAEVNREGWRLRFPGLPSPARIPQGASLMVSISVSGRLQPGQLYSLLSGALRPSPLHGEVAGRLFYVVRNRMPVNTRLTKARNV